jgi:glycerol-3-phosphate dehydrogenase (NAD(P)+)
MKLHILGQGRWGQAVGRLAMQNRHDVVYVHHQDSAWPAGGEALLIALPVQHLRVTLQRFSPPTVPILSLSKGLEIETGFRVSQIIQDLWPQSQVAALSGPNLAAEIQAGLPAAAVVASSDEPLAAQFQQLLHQPLFRLYRSTDLTGVEWGGALKNIYAIAGGVCAGLKLGENAFAALMTRCLAEMTRLGIQAGGRPETFAGLSGVGDLFLTAVSPLSRNHRVGQMLAEGRKLEAILADSPGVAEGIPTTEAMHRNQHPVQDSQPVITQIHALLFAGKPPGQAVADLMGRSASAES